MTRKESKYSLKLRPCSSGKETHERGRFQVQFHITALRKEKKRREKTEEEKNYISKRRHNATNRATRKQRLNIFSPSINKVEAMKSVEVKRDVRTAVTKQEKEHI